MGITDKAKNEIQKAKGEVKEALGKRKGDPDLEAEGRADRTKGSTKNAAENVKDAFKK